MLDVNITNPGDNHENLPETYVIFITENDVLKKNLPIYHIERVILETGELFDDQSHIIYVNNEVKDNTPLGKLMQDFKHTNADNMNYDILAERVRYFKENDEGVSSMCKAMEEMRAEVAAKAAAKATAETKIDTLITSIRNIIANANKTVAEAMAILGIPESEREFYYKLLQ